MTSFTTLNQLETGESSRRDDIEAILLILIYFFKGSLPWEGIAENNGQSDKKMDELKAAIKKVPIKVMCFLISFRFFAKECLGILQIC